MIFDNVSFYVCFYFISKTAIAKNFTRKFLITTHDLLKYTVKAEYNVNTEEIYRTKSRKSRFLIANSFYCWLKDVTTANFIHYLTDCGDVKLFADTWSHHNKALDINFNVAEWKLLWPTYIHYFWNFSFLLTTCVTKGKCVTLVMSKMCHLEYVYCTWKPTPHIKKRVL